MAQVREVIKRLADGPVKRQGLLIEQVYDETDYINSSINLVRTNILYGGILAIIVLIVALVVPVPSVAPEVPRLPASVVVTPVLTTMLRIA